MSDFEVIDNTAICELSKADIQALLDGKMLATTINDDEYSIFIRLEGDSDR